MELEEDVVGGVEASLETVGQGGESHGVGGTQPPQTVPHLRPNTRHLTSQNQSRIRNE